jgi:hypothetical protein
VNVNVSVSLSVSASEHMYKHVCSTHSMFLKRVSVLV